MEIVKKAQKLASEEWSVNRQRNSGKAHPLGWKKYNFDAIFQDGKTAAAVIRSGHDRRKGHGQI